VTERHSLADDVNLDGNRRPEESRDSPSSKIFNTTALTPVCSLQVSNAAPSVEAHHGARRLGAGCACWRCWLGRRLVGFVVVIPICSVVPVSL
jgi:hypothetical protein